MREYSVIADLIAAIPNAAIVLTHSGELCAANASARELLGIESESERSLTAEQLLSTLLAISPQFETVLQRAYAGAHAGALPIYERVINNCTGQWTDVHITACGPTMLLLNVRDTSEHDRRLAVVGQLAAGIIHDVNNVLNPILSAAYLLQHHAESPDMVREYAERIRKAAETGAATAARVGRFIRQEPMPAAAYVAMNLSTVAEELLELVEPMLTQRARGGAPVQIVRRLAPTAPMHGVAGDIREALLNVFVNAIDALSETGGRITVRTEQLDSDVVVTIVDTGEGMSDDVRERAFEPFFSTKGARGSGLGLAEVYGIVSRHRGTATLESRVGHGTTVTLRFPTDMAPELVAASELARTANIPLRILLVEDHDDGREFLGRLLTMHGHTVHAVASIAAAREKLASATKLQYHLMLTDVGLPDGSGWDLVSVARSLAPDIRIGVITGWEPVAHSSGVDGVDFVLRKPLRAAELLSHIAGINSLAQPE